jgi:hypothetical protein
MRRIIILSGDVHHYSIQGFPELDYSLDYLDVVRRLDIKCTLFLTGRCVVEDRRKVERMINEYQGFIEIGAHSYNANYLLLGHRISIDAIADRLREQRLGRCFITSHRIAHVPLSLYYLHDVCKCVKTFASIGVRPISWRGHAYRRRVLLYKLLRKFGFQVVSDVLSDTFNPHLDEGLLQVPVTLADDRLVSYAFLVNRPTEFFKLLRSKVAKIVNSKGPACIQLHPLYMKIIGFKRMEELLRIFVENNYEFITMRDLLGYNNEHINKHIR